MIKNDNQIIDKEFQPISQYVHSYYIKGLHSNLLKFKTPLLEQFSNTDLSQPSEHYSKIYTDKLLKINNIELNLQPISKNVQSIFTYLITKYFSNRGESKWGISKVGCYVQDNKECQSFFHHHYLDSSIVGVTYIDPPIKEEGGGIEFDMANTNPTDDPFIIYPKPDYFYLFPSWVLHRPLPQTSTIPRISLNLGIDTISRPLHKLTNVVW